MLTSNDMVQFRVNLKDFRNTDFIAKSIPNLTENQVLVKIYKFAFTANNISYVNLGESFGYWKFFPTEDNFGIPPVWGFGKILFSQNPELKEGETIYGFFPAASHVILETGKIRPIGFTDVSSHRLKLPAIYNFYNINSNDSLYRIDRENIQLVYKPLFTTAFLLDDFFSDNHFFGAENIIITSASSKTALALAYLCKARKEKENSRIKLIALSSNRNLDFIKEQNYFDEVISYENLNSLPKEKSAIIDFAGNKNILSKLENFLADNLNYLCLVGLVHWENKLESGEESKGKVFFAPSQMKKRAKDWGLDGFQNKLAENYLDFIERASHWIKFIEINNSEEFSKLYLDTLEGRLKPDNGYIVSFD